MLDYHVGLEVHPQSGTSLYRKADLDKIKHLPSFDRNFNGKWGHGAGDIFDTNMINAISREAYEFPENLSLFPNVLAIDPAYGEMRNKLSSKFAGLGMYKENNKIFTRSYFELESPGDTEAVDRIAQEIESFGYTRLIIDGHYTGIIKEFKNRIKTKGFPNDMKVEATDKASEVVRVGGFQIHLAHEELAKQMRAIRRDQHGGPDKKRYRYDLGDCAHMGIWELAGGSGPEPAFFKVVGR